MGLSVRYIFLQGHPVLMITIEIREKDLRELARTEVKNLPGSLFAGSSPLLRPFMKNLEALLPAENRVAGAATFSVPFTPTSIQSAPTSA